MISTPGGFAALDPPIIAHPAAQSVRVLRLGERLLRLHPTVVAVEASARGSALVRLDDTAGHNVIARWPIARRGIKQSESSLIYQLAAPQIAAFLDESALTSTLILFESAEDPVADDRQLAGALSAAASGLTALHEADYRNIVLVAPPIAASATPEEAASVVAAFALLSTQLAADLRGVPTERYASYASATVTAGACLHIVRDAVEFCRQACTIES